MAGHIPSYRSCATAGVLALLVVFAALMPASAQTPPVLARFLSEVAPGDVVEGADAFGPVREDLPVAAILKGGERVGWAFITSDFVGTTGYSGKPIHIMMAVGPDAMVLGAELVKHSEPIVLVGIPESKIRALIDSYTGLDLVAEAESEGKAHELDIISGATVTVMVIDDSVVRSGLKVARALGLGGLEKKQQTGPRFAIDSSAGAPADWTGLTGEGAVRRLTLDVGQINAAFAETGDKRAIDRPEPGPDADTFIDMVTAQVGVPALGKALLTPQEYANLAEWLEPGDHAILIAGRGRYSFKGSGYVRGGIFDRIALVQGDITLRFTDKMHRRLGGIAAPGAPAFSDTDLFKVPADSGFDPTRPWRIELLVQRRVGPVDKVFLTYDLAYRLPGRYLTPLAPATPAAAAEGSAAATADKSEAAAKRDLWKRIWWQKRYEVAGLVAMLGILTLAFFFQQWITRRERAFFWFRIGFLTLTLFFLGWYANAQLSVVNLMALAASLASGFTWDAFLMEPMTFILWFSVAAALIFWGRGAYCGWLCPFGALQELLNRIAKALRIPQWRLPFGLHDRLRALKYMIFLALFGLSLASMPLAERFAEVEPFKTAIILKFERAWPFVLFALLMLAPGLFIERFYCRYVCPLGGALAIPARMRMFDWLRRYHECGNPCQSCANECPVQAIHPTGEIDPNECVNCLHCQVLYQSDTKCPVVIRQIRRRAKLAESGAALGAKLDPIDPNPRSKGEER